MKWTKFKRRDNGLTNHSLELSPFLKATIQERFTTGSPRNSWQACINGQAIGSGLFLELHQAKAAVDKALLSSGQAIASYLVDPQNQKPLKSK